MSSATIQTSRVHFPAELAKPPADRQRKGLDYPKVAQCKDSNVSTSDRQTSEDLYWGQRAVASPDTETDELSRLADFPAAPGRHAVAKRGLFFTFLRVLTSAKPADEAPAALEQRTGSSRAAGFASSYDPALDLEVPSLIVTPTNSASSSDSSEQDSERDSMLRGRNSGHDAFIHVHSRGASEEF